MSITPSPEPNVATRDSWFGFRLPIEIIAAPARAFGALREGPEWLTAYALVVASGLAELALSSPALVHLIGVLPPPLGMAGKPAAQVADAAKGLLQQSALEQLLMPLFWIGLSATVMTSISRFKGEETSFRVYVALAANCLVPTIFGNLLSGVAVAIHPPASFHDYRAILVALPDNFALLADPQNARETSFLAAFDVFTLWSTILLAFGFTAVTPIKFNTALAVSFTLLLVLASFTA